MSAKEQDFLPAGYEPPKATGRYTKFEEGKTTRIRILCSPILGYEYWDKTTSKPVPVRVPYTQEGLDKANREAKKNVKSDDQKVSHFWIMTVWNYETKQLEVCEITQKTIQSQIRNLMADSDYGNPKKWDVKVKKTKEKDKTTYEIAPGLPGPVDKEIQAEFDNGGINLEAMFYGADPFDNSWIRPSNLDAEDVF